MWRGTKEQENPTIQIKKKQKAWQLELMTGTTESVWTCIAAAKGFKNSNSSNPMIDHQSKTNQP